MSSAPPPPLPHVSTLLPQRRKEVSSARSKYNQGVAKMQEMQSRLSQLRAQIADLVSRPRTESPHSSPTVLPHRTAAMRSARCGPTARLATDLPRVFFSQAPERERGRGEVEALLALIEAEKRDAEAAVAGFVPAEAAALAAVAECGALRAECNAALQAVMPPLQVIFQGPWIGCTCGPMRARGLKCAAAAAAPRCRAHAL
jgi:dynein heavy chain